LTNIINLKYAQRNAEGDQKKEKNIVDVQKNDKFKIKVNINYHFQLFTLLSLFLLHLICIQRNSGIKKLKKIFFLCLSFFKFF